MSLFASSTEKHDGKSHSDTISNADSNGQSKAAVDFLQRIKKGVENGLSRPVPGILKIIRNPSDGEVNNNSTAVTMKNEIFAPPAPLKTPTAQTGGRQVTPYKLGQFEKVLNTDTVDMNALRKISWNGVPSHFRPMVWQILLGYLPIKRDRREDTIRRKRKEYQDSIPTYFTISEADRTTQEGEILRQISVDLPRTCPNNPFFHQQVVRKAMERILYIWSIRHPASGYVQGLNDLLTPLLLICTQNYVDDPLRCDIGSLEPHIFANIEADCYWCFTKLMDNIQDHYTFSQPGIQRMIMRLEDLVHRLDAELHQHLLNEGIQFIHFSFRWMNCALIRELPLKSIIRLWDTYFSEEHGGFENFHVYVCVVVLKMFKEKLMTMNFQEMILFLQDLPTNDWEEEEVEPILSQAFILSTLFENSPNHLA